SAILTLVAPANPRAFVIPNCFPQPTPSPDPGRHYWSNPFSMARIGFRNLRPGSAPGRARNAAWLERAAVTVFAPCHDGASFGPRATISPGTARASLSLSFRSAGSENGRARYAPSPRQHVPG